MKTNLTPVLAAGPNTLVGLAKPAAGDNFDASRVISTLLPAYESLLAALKDIGVPEVQFCSTKEVSSNAVPRLQI